MGKYITIFMLMFPVFTYAQKELFMKEFNEVNNWFFDQQEIALVQKYIYYKDSAMAYPIDSSVCTIIKKNTAIHYIIRGMESFCDSGYMVKIRHSDKYITVSKIEKTDTLQLKTLFSEGFSGFNIFTKTIQPKSISSWVLSGGTAGVNSANIVLDRKNHKIKFLEIAMAGDHPLLSPFSKRDETLTPVIIKVDYQYLDKVKKEDVVVLSDNLSSINKNRQFDWYVLFHI